MRSKSILEAVIVAVFAVTVQGAPIVIFDGSSMPKDQGWEHGWGHGVGGSLSVSSTAGVLNVDSTGAGNEISNYKKHIGSYPNFMYSACLRIIESKEHAGVYFSFVLNPFGPDSLWNPTPDPTHGPAESAGYFYFDEDAVGHIVCVNYSEVDTTHLMDTTGGFHLYSLEVGTEFANLYVDSVPVLTGYFPAPVLTDGYVSFGDHTNMWGFNSNVDIDYITYEVIAPPTANFEKTPIFDYNPTVIPTPSAIILGTIGVGFVTWLRRRMTL